MSAWYVFTALGFYPVAPGSNEYVIGRPFLPRATLNLPNGKRFTVIADGLDDAHPYIGSVTLNGKPLDRAFLRHEEIMAGGELHFTMQAQPNKAWATALRRSVRTRCRSAEASRPRRPPVSANAWAAKIRSPRAYSSTVRAGDS